MVLETIDSPADLKALPAEQLPLLAEELRAAIVAAVARVGGHLGSNLGVVELGIALHRTFDSPRDQLVWDTGHQAYVHKMLTGRRPLFDTLRQAGGLSGYPCRAESPHDLVENSHASTALSWAFGLARAQVGLPREERRRVVAVVGDGALTGGMAYEALNNLGHHQLPAIIVLNDNGRSYAETVSRLSERLADLRTDPRYRKVRGRFDRALDRVPLVERLTDAGFGAVKAAVSEAPALQAFVEALGVRYLGPYDGHDVGKLEHALVTAARLDTPVLVHVLTQKGKGYEPAETDPEKKLHDTSAFDIATGRSTGSKPRSWTQAFSEAVLELADERPDLVAITAAMPGSTGLLPLAERDPERVLDVGIAEQHAVTAAAGMAHAGKLPLFAVYSTFFARGFDQANLDVGLHDAHVLFVFDRAGITGDDGPSHHGILDLSLSLRIPTMTVLAPSCEEDLQALLGVAAGLDGPVSLRFPKGAAVAGAGLGVKAADRALGLRARRLRAGEDVCVLAVGDRVSAALEAAELLAEQGYDAAVWDVRSVRPADPAMLDAAAAAPLVVTVENGVVGGGAGAELVDRLVERVGVRHAPPVLKLGVPDGYLPHGKPDHIMAELGLDAAGVAAATRKVLTDDR
ncbi:1-deoxy-D-xylulose-5-phosphate synthase [Egicoccus sp. AB-alg6-2]|uniref:1-deoxy-D-xylulose-5-phosphate synthase n=1 Tax=Egicoccus sp. AB-alg6-2 TaxID=3242692 RepID=UPI00359CF6DB